MILVHPKIETKFCADKINVLIAEDVRLFRELCRDMIEAVDGSGDKFVLSYEDGKIDNLAKTGLLVTDPLNVDVNDKKVTSKLYAELVRTVEEKFAREISEIGENAIALINKLNAESSVPLDFSDASPVQGLLKAYGVGIAGDGDTLVENLINYLSAWISLCGVTCVFFINIKSYLTVAELGELYKFLKYNGIFVLLLESSCKKKCDGELVVVIDEDLCEIIA